MNQYSRYNFFEFCPYNLLSDRDTGNSSKWLRKKNKFSLIKWYIQNLIYLNLQSGGKKSLRKARSWQTVYKIIDLHM